MVTSLLTAIGKLDFPEGPDPLLAGKQQHAIMLARDRLARLIRSAPSRFQGVGLAGTASGGRGGTSGSNGYGNAEGDLSEGELSDIEQLGQSQDGGNGQGNGYAGGQSSTASTSSSGEAAEGDEMQFGAMGGGGTANGGGDTAGDLAEGNSEAGDGSDAADSNGDLGDRYSQAGGNSDGEAGGAAGGQSSSGEACDNCSASNGKPSAGSSSSSAGGQTSSIADSQGRNWAVKSGGRSSVPIRRPIQVVVRQNQISLLPNRHALDGDAATGKVISLDQPMKQISGEFVAALRSRIEEWGIAGNGLYWRPTLKLHVGPGAEQTAEQVIRLLKNSGVEVSLPETARASTAGAQNAPR